MAEPGVVHLPEPRPPLPDVVDIDMTAGLPPHSPRETTLLQQMTGRTFVELAGEDADHGDRETVLVWFRLRRLGFEPTWEEAQNVLINYQAANPTTAEGSTT
jgi:hypothetical protein